MTRLRFVVACSALAITACAGTSHHSAPPSSRRAPTSSSTIDTAGRGPEPSTTVRSTSTSSAPRTTTTTTTTTIPRITLPPARAFPALLVAVDGSGVHAVAPGSDRLVVKVAHPLVAYRLGDGSVAVETGDAIASRAVHRSLSRWFPDGRHVDYPQFADTWFVGVGPVHGHDNLILVPESNGEDGVPLTLYDTVTGKSRQLGFGAQLDSGTYRASIGAGVVVQSRTADMGQAVGYTTVDGAAARDWPDLAKGLPYPTLDLTSVVVSPGGSRLAYLDGPPQTSDGPDPNVPWALVVVDRSGRVLQRTPLVRFPDAGWFLDYDGTWAVASPRQDAPPIIVHTTSANPSAELLPVAPGVATFDTRR